MQDHSLKWHYSFCTLISSIKSKNSRSTHSFVWCTHSVRNNFHHYFFVNLSFQLCQGCCHVNITVYENLKSLGLFKLDFVQNFKIKPFCWISIMSIIIGQLKIIIHTLWTPTKTLSTFLNSLFESLLSSYLIILSKPFHFHSSFSSIIDHFHYYYRFFWLFVLLCTPFFSTQWWARIRVDFSNRSTTRSLMNSLVKCGEEHLSMLIVSSIYSLCHYNLIERLTFLYIASDSVCSPPSTYDRSVNTVLSNDTRK